MTRGSSVVVIQVIQILLNRCLDKWLWNEAIAVVDDVAMGSDAIDPHLYFSREGIPREGWENKTVCERIRIFRTSQHPRGPHQDW